MYIMTYNRTSLQTWQVGLLSVLFGGISAVVGPVAYYGVTYFGGRGIFPRMWSSFLVFPLLMAGSALSLLCFFLLCHLFRLSQHDSARVFTGIVAVCVFFAHYPLMFRMPPNGLIWTNGFVAGLTSRGQLDELQAWSIERLAEYQKGTLKTIDSASSSPLSFKKLDPAIIPEYVQNIGGSPPSEGISLAMIPRNIVNPERAFDDSGEIGGYCITMSWYNFGLIVGDPPDFQSQPDSERQWTHPWNLREVQPGIFVYYNEK
jgi:hypothetical protein